MPISDDEYKEIINWCENIPDKSLFDDKNFDNLSNIYYLKEIYTYRNYPIKPELKNKIIAYVKSLETNDGLFALSLIDKRNINDNEHKLDSTTFLSTFLAIDILNFFNLQPENPKILYRWIDNMFNNDTYINDKSIAKNSNLLMLLKISNLLKYDISKYHKQIDRFSNSFNTILISELTNKKSIPIMFIDSIIDLDILLKKDDFLLNNKEVIKEYYDNLQSSDGWFGLVKGDQGNILPTYMALKYYSYFKFSVSNKSKIVNLIRKNRILYEGYALLYTFQSELTATYYVYNIDKLLHLNAVNINNYLSKNPINKDNLNPYNAYYYLKLCKQSNIKVNKKEYEDLAASIKLNISKNSLDSVMQCFDMIRYIEVLDLLGIKIDKQSIISKINTNNKQCDSAEEKYFKVCTELKLLKLLGAKKDKNIIDKINVLIEYINNYECLRENHRLLFLYNAFEALDTWKIDIPSKISYSKITELLNKCKTKGSTFEYDINSFPCFVSTYYALVILNKIK